MGTNQEIEGEPEKPKEPLKKNSTIVKVFNLFRIRQLLEKNDIDGNAVDSRNRRQHKATH